MIASLLSLTTRELLLALAAVVFGACLPYALVPGPRSRASYERELRDAYEAVEHWQSEAIRTAAALDEAITPPTRLADRRTGRRLPVCAACMANDHDSCGGCGCMCNSGRAV